MMIFLDIKIEQFLLILMKSCKNFLFVSLNILICSDCCSPWHNDNNLNSFEYHSLNYILLVILSMNSLRNSYYLYHLFHSFSSTLSHPIQSSFYFQAYDFHYFLKSFSFHLYLQLTQHFFYIDQFSKQYFFHSYIHFLLFEIHLHRCFYRNLC